MSSTVIKVENLAKQYRLGKIGTGSFSHDVNRWWHMVRGKEDPYKKIGDTNDRTVKGDSNYVWSLRDINLSVRQGEVVGLIGRNGAGKSTLLKILSRTTAPTIGKVKIKGRVASLLEVGTGFHPELTGRENIFLNGAILGMTKAEIKRKFDEIVSFSGVERYVDTPVKRYSSGMYVRLAFGIAAHLEPEILIVDEVLAVGDAEFQKKALGKMKDVSSKDGRTVLFVSHNMTAINNICEKGIILKNGMLDYSGPIGEAIARYLNLNPSGVEKNQKAFEAVSGDGVRLLDIFIRNHDESMVYSNEAEIEVIVDYEVLVVQKPRIVFTLLDEFENIVLSNSNYYNIDEPLQTGNYRTTFKIPKMLLNKGYYSIAVRIDLPRHKVLISEAKYLSFQIDLLSKDNFGEISADMKEPLGIIHPFLEVKTDKKR